VFAATSSSVNVNQQEITSAAREVASRVASDVTSSNFNSTLNSIQRNNELFVSVNPVSNTDSLKSYPLQVYLFTVVATIALAYF
jgi:hypothetical protein